MKKLLLAAAITTAMSATLSPLAMAADDSTASPHDDATSPMTGSINKVYASWSLSNQQQQQIATADQNLGKRLEQLKAQRPNADKGPSQQDRQAFRDAVKTHHDALAKVLDADQLKVLEALHQRQHAGHMKGRLMQALIRSWHLDDAQQQALKQAHDSMRQDLHQLRRQQFDSRADKRAAFKQIKQAQHERLAKVLDPEQLKVYAMMRHVELRGPKGHPPMAGVRALIASWHLDQNKQQAFDQATKNFFKQMHQLHTPPQPDADKPSKSDRDQRHQQVREAIAHYRAQLGDILTPAQLAALEVFAPHHGHGRNHSSGFGSHGPGMMEAGQDPGQS